MPHRLPHLGRSSPYWYGAVGQLWKHTHPVGSSTPIARASGRISMGRERTVHADGAGVDGEESMMQKQM
jgi:hypothetical protein